MEGEPTAWKKRVSLDVEYLAPRDTLVSGNAHEEGVEYIDHDSLESQEVLCGP